MSLGAPGTPQPTAYRPPYAGPYTPPGGYTGSTGGSTQPRPTYTWRPPSLTVGQIAAISSRFPTTPSPSPSGGGSPQPAEPSVEPEGPDLEALKSTELAASMRAIAAKYAAARGGLKQERSLLGLTNRAEQASSRRTERQTLEDQLNQFAGGGIARSGIAATELAATANAAAASRASSMATFRAQRGYITQQLRQGLITQREAEEAQARAAIESAFAMHQLQQPMEA